MRKLCLEGYVTFISYSHFSFMILQSNLIYLGDRFAREAELEDT